MIIRLLWIRPLVIACAIKIDTFTQFNFFQIETDGKISIFNNIVDIYVKMTKFSGGNDWSWFDLNHMSVKNSDKKAFTIVFAGLNGLQLIYTFFYLTNCIETKNFVSHFLRLLQLTRP